ncbi:MAG: GGDEF domain-containing protein [Burkholderiales bacterium]|nr:GGDEF domain-containing protein [Burkholderiales bacterium]OJX09075.1 MAG: hypothetical protein BGO72_19400 [Burkholderiales bacterium 70-64]
MTTATPIDSESARLARSALRYLAEHGLPPTPERYGQAWRAVGGVVRAAAIGPLVAEAVRQLDVGHRNWTLARKKQALARVLACGDDQVLAIRLRSLVESWRHAPDDAAVETAPRGAAGAIDAERLLADLTSLLAAICETVPRLVEEEAWVRQQFDAIRANLGSRDGQPDPRDLEQARVLLRRTAEEHQRLLKLRRDSLQMMKTMIAQCIEWLRGLTASSARFGEKLGAYIGEIERADDLPALAGTVRGLIEDTRSMHLEIESSKHDFAAAAERATHLEQEVERLAGELRSTGTQLMTDHLTRLLNRRGLERTFRDMLAACDAQTRPFAVALLDVDDFKKLNDALGHQTGDDALRHLAAVLAAGMRPGDCAARYGGEEFVLLLSGAGARDAAEAVRRLQRTLAADVFLHRSGPVRVTFSAGVAEVRRGETLEQALARADDAMYEAKRAGKNRVIVASPGERLIAD